MKRSLSLLILFMILFLTGCYNPIEPIEGAKPTKDFVVDDYISSNAIFQQKQDIRLFGTSEVGVVLKATLYDYKNRIVDYEYATVQDDDTWKMNLEAPSSSFEQYKIVIHDLDEIYVKEFTNILFGEVWLLIGEGLINTPYDLDFYIEPQLRFYQPNISSGKWLTTNQKNQISSFAYHFAKKINQDHKVPVGIILAGISSTSLHTWLSDDLISNSNVLDFINLTKKIKQVYDDEISSLYHQKIKPISKITVNGIVFNQGLTDIFTQQFTSVQDKSLFFQLYAKTLTHLMDEWHQTYDSEIYIIQNPSLYNDSVVDLRNAQAIGSFYYNYTTIIPTYDIIQDDDLKILNEDIKTIAERVALVAKTKTYQERINYLPPSYINYIIASNYVEIEFANISRFNPGSMIDTLTVKDIDGNVLEVTTTYERNWLIINLPIIDNGYPLIGEISYAMVPNASHANFKNNFNIPAVPFKIIINERN